MKQFALAAFANLALISAAHAQAWPNAQPSPYGQNINPPAVQEIPREAPPYPVSTLPPPAVMPSAPMPEVIPPPPPPAPIATVPAPRAPSGQVLGAPPQTLSVPASSTTTLPPPPPPVAVAPATIASDPDSPQGERATNALNYLEQQGFDTFSDFQPSGNGFTAMVVDRGRHYRVYIDPDTGAVTRP